MAEPPPCAQGRPTGVTVRLYSSFHKVSLQPLSATQQTNVVRLRLGARGFQEEHVDGLMEYIHENLAELAENPLLLSLVISVFEKKKKLDAMPSNKRELCMRPSSNQNAIATACTP